MKTLVVNPVLREQLHGLGDQMEVRDDSGQIVGMFLPIGTYQALLGNIRIPLSDKEIERRKKEPGAIPLQEFWKMHGGSTNRR
jgi:hypothetical protein